MKNTIGILIVVTWIYESIGRIDTFYVSLS